MGFALPLITAASTAIGGGTGLAAVGAVASGVGAVYSTIANVQAANFQAAVAMSQQEQLELNAAGARTRAGAEAQDQDFANLLAMEEVLAQQGASGFATTSASLADRRQLNRVLATQDRERIVLAGETEARNLQSQANTAGVEAQLASNRATTAAIAGTIDVGSTLITGASNVNKAFARKVRRDSVVV